MAILGRVLEAAGFRVGIVSQPDWRSCDEWRRFGPPRLFFAISAGNMDSMINHYTANRKVRNDDAYSPGGQDRHAAGPRHARPTASGPARPTRACRLSPVAWKPRCGGWPTTTTGATTVRHSILHRLQGGPAGLTAWARKAIVEIARRLDAGEPVRGSKRDMRGSRVHARWARSRRPPDDAIKLPSFERRPRPTNSPSPRRQDIIHNETNPFNARTARAVARPASGRLQPAGAADLRRVAMDAIYGLPYTRQAAPRATREPIPAYEMIKDSITIMRGCFGGCTFCSITTHQGRIVPVAQPKQSILGRGATRWRPTRSSRASVSDIGGPTANMYEHALYPAGGRGRYAGANPACIPTICKLLGTEPRPADRGNEGRPRDARHQQGARRQRHPHGPGPPVAALHAGPDATPRRAAT